MKSVSLNVIYEDVGILVCRKPAGIPVQTAKTGQQDLVSLLINYRAKKGEETYIGTVHRLDQPVEGVMVFAKTKEAAANLSRQIAEKRTKKIYCAVVKGRLDRQEGILEHRLVRDGRNNLSHVAAPGEKNAKEARLWYQVLAYKAEPDQSLVKIRLDTGRHHQIRVQFAAEGHPLLGDRKYNPQPGGGNVALCACEVSFFNPGTGEWQTFQTRPENPYFEVFSGFREVEQRSLDGCETGQPE